MDKKTLIMAGAGVASSLLGGWRRREQQRGNRTGTLLALLGLGVVAATVISVIMERRPKGRKYDQEYAKLSA